TSRQLVDFVETKLKQYGIGKVIPDPETLALTYEMFAASDRLYEAFNEMREKLDERGTHDVPADLAAKVEAELEKHPDITWHRAIRQIVDPDASEDADDDENDGELDDEDLDDVDD